MKRSLFYLSTRWFARDLVKEAMQGILRREPDPTGWQAYEDFLRNTRDLAAVLGDLSGSDEFWERNLAEHAPELVDAVFRGMLDRQADPETLDRHAAALAANRDLSQLSMEISRSDEFWNKSVALHAPELIRIVFRALLGREPEPGALKSYASRLTQAKDLPKLLDEIAGSTERWENSLREHAPQLVHAVFRGTLNQKPAPETLQNHASQLRSLDDLTDLLIEISRGEEFWNKSVALHAPELIRIAFLALLGREPEPQALESYESKLAHPEDLKKVLAEIADSPERWEKTLASHSAELVRAAFQGLLQREPEEEALRAYRDTLVRKPDLTQVLQEIGRSDEHWGKSLRARAPELVRAVFQGAIGGEPESEALRIYSQKLKSAADLTPFFSEIFRSDRFAEVQRKRKSHPDPAKSYEAPTLVFLHLHKTAGTSLQQMLLDAYADRAIYHEHSDSLYQYSPGELSKYSAFLGHFNHDSLAFIPRRTLSIVTFVRNPKERLISHYYFWRAHEPAHVSYHMGMQAANELPMEKYFLDSRLEGELAYYVWNHQTWAIMGQRQWESWRALLGSTPDERSIDEIISKTVRPAISRRLREFMFVGLQEEFDLSVRHLFRILDRPLPDADYSLNTLKGNVEAQPNFKRKLDKQPITPLADIAMNRLVQLDNVVYEEARTLFQERQNPDKSLF